MSKRYQRGTIYKFRNYWMGQYRREGRRVSVRLGNRCQMTKTQARAKLSEILHPLNLPEPCKEWRLKDFVDQVWLPFQLRKWKESTAYTSQSRIVHELLPELGERKLGDFDRDGLQDFLDAKAGQFGKSTLRHLRWDLNSIFRMAMVDGYIQTNPAALLFVPHGREKEKRRLQMKDLSTLLGCLDLREQVICSLAVLVGMRPGEIFALQWKHVLWAEALGSPKSVVFGLPLNKSNKGGPQPSSLKGDDAESISGKLYVAEADCTSAGSIKIEQRIYLGKVATPKNGRERIVAIPQGLMRLIEEYRQTSASEEEGWLFPSVRLKTPARKENVLSRFITPRLKAVGLEWVNFQVMRRTHSTLMRELGVDPKLVAEQLGHDVDVTLNVYTQSMLEQRKSAVNQLEAEMQRAAREGMRVQ